MAAITIRNIPPKLVRSLKALAKRHHRSMEQEVRHILESHVGDRLSALQQLEALWAKQSRRPTADEIDTWIEFGRP